jgi:hypothetical protein
MLTRVRSENAQCDDSPSYVNISKLISYLEVVNTYSIQYFKFFRASVQ